MQPKDRRKKTKGLGKIPGLLSSLHSYSFYNQNNTYHDVERENTLARKAFILGIPTAISFGVVSVGEKYGAMYELVDSQTISSCIARDPGQVEVYAKLMAEMAHTIHSVTVSKDDGFPPASRRVREYIEGGIGQEDPALGEEDPSVIENFMGFSCETAGQFFRFFLKHYFKTEEEGFLNNVTEKASIIGYSRLIRKLRRKERLSEKDQSLIRRCVVKMKALTSEGNWGLFGV